ncbi:protein containing Six-hairpin glycosidase-like domain protein [bacterium]|nr:protein containing Six-hairpin glycosidase-like domain protein [bacterium]MBQ9245995.1 protein containing Six-hairpin glycosidase-like domain protein [bacterium]MBQ9246902.1 protein containing Six-hairpin glycosidase-like domain protein [bacterium]
MDYSVENNKERDYFKKDFSSINILLKKIRTALVEGEKVSTSNLDLSGIIDYEKNLTFVYITLFQEGLKPIRWGSNRSNLDETINRDIEKIRLYKTYSDFQVSNPDKCRIMIEYVTEQIPAEIDKIKYATFVPARFEPGVTGIKIVLQNTSYLYMPTDAWVNSQMDYKTALNSLLRKTYIKNLTNKISERFAILKKTPHQCYIIKSRTFITYKDDILPLYRGNLLYEYSPEAIRDIAMDGADWTLKYQQENGKYLYYYDAKEDNYVDHEHPTRPLDNLYYNDLRHCGGIVTLIRAYQLTKDRKYLEAAKKGLDYSVTLTKEHDYNGQKAGYIFCNRKAKLGGTGMILVAMMKYRVETGDKSYDEYIKMYARHILSRIYKTGEIMGYYIHPDFQNGQPLINMSDEERRATFSFYYPGEALLGLALFANYFKDDEQLRSEVIEKSEIALDWIVDERPKIYADLFTALPSDAWLMQAIEEWATIPEFRKENYINFVFGDAETMMKNMYKKDDSPFIDYEGSYYYNHGDHFYPDGSRSEGLVGAYYLAKKLGREEIADKILKACRLAAKSQMLLYNNEYNNYAHKNPQKSKGAIRFKATRQWIRVDSIQHVACFYFRLYFAEIGLEAK